MQHAVRWRTVVPVAAALLLLAALPGIARADAVVVKVDSMLGFFGGGQGAPPALFDDEVAKSPKILGNFFGGAWAEFPVEAPEDGWYKVTGIESAADPTQGDAFITLDTRPKDGSTHFVTGAILLPFTEGWRDWVTTSTDVLVPLRKGSNVLRVMNITTNLRRPDAIPDYIVSFGGGVNLSWFEFTFERNLEPLGKITGLISSSDLQVPVGFGKVSTGSVKTPHNYWIEDYWTTADAQGQYELEVPAGTYTLTGFRPDTYQPNKVSGVTVTAGQTVTAPEIKLTSNWKNGSLKQESRDVDVIIPGGAAGFYDETWETPIDPEDEDIDNTNIVTGWWDVGDWTEQLVDVAETGWYKVQLRFSSPDFTPLLIRYDANGLVTQSEMEGSGNWRDYVLSEPLDGAILLVKGTNRIRLTLLRGAFNESYHVLTKTTGPDVGLLTGRVLNLDGTPAPAGTEVVAESNGSRSVARTDENGVYQAYSAVGTYTVTLEEIPGYKLGDVKTGIQVTKDQTTTVPDLRGGYLPFFLGVDPAKPAERPHDDDFTGTSLASKWTPLNLGWEDSGDAQVKDGVLETTATQNDIWGNADNGHFVYQKVKGDFIAYVKVVSIPTFEEMGDWSKHGLMARLNEEAGSPHFTVLCGTGRRTINEYRMEQDGATASGAQPAETFQPGQWLKLVRKGDTFSAFWCYDNQGTETQVALPLGVTIPAFAEQDEILLGMVDTTGLAAAGVPAYATYSTFRVIPFQEAMDSVPVEPPPPVGVKGDVDGNGQVAILDVVVGLRIVAGLATATPGNLAGGDLNGNGRIEITEVVQILRAVAGLGTL